MSVVGWKCILHLPLMCGRNAVPAGPQQEIMKLMLYESSNKKSSEMTSFTEYIDRMPEDQNKIYYLIARNRAMAEASPCVNCHFMTCVCSMCCCCCAFFSRQARHLLIGHRHSLIRAVLPTLSLYLSQPHSLVMLRPVPPIVSLSCCLLPHCLAVSLPRRVAVLLSRCFATSLACYLAISPSRHLAISPSRRLTVSPCR